jgi:uncharacterized protein involved in propanediol utilization
MPAGGPICGHLHELLGGVSEACITGHFGEWLQGRLGMDGPIVLVTLPCPSLCVTVAWQAGGALRIDGPAADLMTRDRARTFLQRLRLPTDGTATVAADMPAGGGAGASTAALLALAGAVGGATLAPDQVAAACIAAEGASDPLMLQHPDTHLWASREGRSLRRIAAPPAFDVVGGFFGPPVWTDPADWQLPDVSDLAERWSDAARIGDIRALARIASASADRTTALRGPPDDPTAELANKTGALGHVRAHTGSARGLLFAPGTIPAGVKALLAGAGFRAVLQFRTGS